MRLLLRSAAGLLGASLVVGIAGCGGEDEAVNGADAGAVPPPAAAPVEEGTRRGSTELPGAVGASELPKVDSARGVVLVQEDKDGGCVILTYDGRAGLLGTFAPFRAEHQPRTQRCDSQRRYSADFKTRVGEIYANWQNANSFENHTVVQPIAAEEVDVTKSGNLTDPVIGPDGKIYLKQGRLLAGDPSVMNLDGSELRALPDGESDPAWLGGKLVSTRILSSSVSNPDGSLAVQYISGSRPRYRVGPVKDGRVDGDLVVPTGQALKPLAWVGDNRFLASEANVIYVGTVVSGGEKPTITMEPLATLPEPYAGGGTDSVRKMVACADRAYFTVQMGGTQTLPDHQSVLLSVDPADGTLTAHVSLKDHAAAGDRHTTEVIGCGR